MIKSERGKPDKHPAIRDYPLLMVGPYGGIVLMIAYQKGFVVSDCKKNNTYAIGHHEDNWAEWEMKPYTGKITLQNQDVT